MTPRLVSSRFPFLPITLTIRQGTWNFEALIDTGFDGDLVLPRATLAGEQPDSYLRYRLADGSVSTYGTFVGTLALGRLGQFPATVVELGDEPLIGRGITDRLRLTLDHGHQVIAEL